MRKRKREISLTKHITLLGVIIVLNLLVELSSGLMSANCLAGSPGCNCSWKSGKFVADCSQQNLTRVPKNDHFDFMLASAGNNQMPTLNRDIQQLNLSSNNISNLGDSEFIEKKFRNLQKIYLNGNQLLRIHSNAFYKLTGLIELDLSENMITSFSSASDEDEEVSPADHDKVSVHAMKVNKNNKQASLEANSTRSKKSATSKSFLKDLAQLRVLNMNSNRLTRCDKFTFSPLVQLRQLFLSRNKISFIDKRAFDGLNVLNILHLDGNKLSHLDGGILLKLPQLHAIQLAGSNEWNCDCKLRKLMRQLASDEISERAHKEERSLIQLQDDPVCIVQQGEKTARSWKNMTFTDLQCQPRIAEQFLMVEEKSSQNAQLNLKDHSSKFRLEGTYLIVGEPLELTCAVKLNDDLEANEQTLEWWQLETQTSKLPLKLWSSSSSNKTSPTSPERFVVIDYVTRANSSESSRKLTAAMNQSQHNLADAKIDDDDDDDDDEDDTNGELIRVSHLVGASELVTNELGQLIYLCRVTNKFNASSTLDLIYPISVDLPSNKNARIQSEVRSDLRRLTSSLSLPALSPLYIPLHLPAGLSPEELNESSTSPILDLLSRGPHQTRPSGPATRQINATLRNSTSHHHPLAEQQTRSLLNGLTIALTTRFSSNQAHLIRPPSDLTAHATDSNESNEGSSSQLYPVAPSWRNPPPTTSNFLIELLNMPLGWLSHQLVTFDKSSTTPTPILLLLAGLCAGLLVGCLLTLGLALRFRSHRVGSSSSTQLTATKPDPPIDSPKLSSHTSPAPGTRSPSTPTKSPQSQLGIKKMKIDNISEPLWLVPSEGDEADAEDELMSNNDLELCFAQSPAVCPSQVAHLHPTAPHYLTLGRQTKACGLSRKQERLNKKSQLNELNTSNDSSSTILLPINENHHQHHYLCASLINSNCQCPPLLTCQPYENYTTAAHLMRRANLKRQMNSSSVTSPAASTSSTSLTPMTNHQQLSQNQPTDPSHLYAHNDSDTNNLVYLEDALQLLQHSVNDCVLLSRNKIDEEQHRL